MAMHERRLPNRFYVGDTSKLSLWVAGAQSRLGSWRSVRAGAHAAAKGATSKMLDRVKIAHRGVNFTRSAGAKMQIHWEIALALVMLE